MWWADTDHDEWTYRISDWKPAENVAQAIEAADKYCRDATHANDVSWWELAGPEHKEGYRVLLYCQDEYQEYADNPALAICKTLLAAVRDEDT